MSWAPFKCGGDDDTGKVVIFDSDASFLCKTVFEYETEPAVGVAWDIDGGGGDKIVPGRNLAFATSVDHKVKFASPAYEQYRIRND